MESNTNTPKNIGHAEAYFNQVNSAGIIANNPELRYTPATDLYSEPLDFDNPEFQKLWESADGPTKKELIKASSLSHAQKIYERREVYKKSQKLTEQDPLWMQIGMSILPAVTDPASVVPVAGALGATLKVAKNASRLNKIMKYTAEGAAVGVGTNLASEAMFDTQGLQHDYVSAAAGGLILGGSLGMLSGVLSGPSREVAARALSSEKDTYKKDYETDPNLEVETVDGAPRIVGMQNVEQMKDNIFTKASTLGGWLRSDVHTVYMSPSQALRNVATRFFKPTVSLKDVNGNIIPSRWNAMDYKREVNGVHNTLSSEVSDAYQEAKINGYKGSRDDFVKEVSRTYTEASVNQEKRAYELSKSGNVDYSKVEVEFSHPNAYVNKAAESYKKYYNTMLKKGHDVKIKELMKLSTDKLYRPRMWKFKEIKNMPTEELSRIIKNALASHPNQKALGDKELTEATNYIVNKLQEVSWDTNLLNKSWVVPKDMPFQGMLKAKKFKLDETKLEGLLDDNLDNVTGAYHYKMSGRQAINFASDGKDIPEIMEELRTAMLEEGNVAAEEELKAFNRLLQDITGDLRLNSLSDDASWTFTRNLTSFNSARLGGGFGGNQFIELASAVLMNGFSNIIDGRFANSFKNAAKYLYTKDKVTDEFSRALVASGYLEDVLHTHRINRYSEAESGLNPGIIENTLNGLNDKLMKLNGMRYFIGVMEDMTGGAIVTEIQKIGKKSSLSETEVKRLARWGLSPEEARELAKDFDKYTDIENGKFDLESFSPENRDRFQLAISRGIEEVVVQGDSIHLPNFMKVAGPWTKVITQFMRFPMLANEILLRRGFTEDQARIVGGIISSIVTYVGLKYLREQATIALGFTDSRDSKYDYFGTDGKDNLGRAVLEALNYTAQLGMFSTYLNYGLNLTGNSELGRDYANRDFASAFLGPTLGGLGGDVLDITSKAAQGKLDSEEAATKAKSLIPGGNLPIINEGLKALIEEL